jgi:hypothetical protein
MLLEVKSWIRVAVLLLICIYVAGFEWCLFANAERSSFRDYSLIGFGFLLQAVSLTALTPLILRTSRYAEAVRVNLKTETFRVFAWIGPFFFLLLSVSLVMLGLYNRGLNEKIENSRMQIEAIRKCYLLDLNCGSQPPRAGELVDGGPPVYQ